MSAFSWLHFFIVLTTLLLGLLQSILKQAENGPLGRKLETGSTSAYLSQSSSLFPESPSSHPLSGSCMLVQSLSQHLIPAMKKLIKNQMIKTKPIFSLGMNVTNVTMKTPNNMGVLTENELVDLI